MLFRSKVPHQSNTDGVVTYFTRVSGFSGRHRGMRYHHEFLGKGYSLEGGEIAPFEVGLYAPKEDGIGLKLTFERYDVNRAWLKFNEL